MFASVSASSAKWKQVSMYLDGCFQRICFTNGSHNYMEVIINCTDGTICKHYCRIAPANLQSPLQYPSNAHLLSQSDVANSTSCANMNFYFTDNNGDTLAFRNACNQAEADQLEAWWQEIQPDLRALINSSGDSDKYYAPLLVSKNLSDNEKVMGELFSRFMDARYKDVNETQETIDKMAEEDKPVLDLLFKAESNLSIASLPSKENNQQLKIKLVTKLLPSEVTVLNEQKQEIWKGIITNEAVINFGGQQSGIYFVQGIGKALTVKFKKA